MRLNNPVRLHPTPARVESEKPRGGQSQAQKPGQAGNGSLAAGQLSSPGRGEAGYLSLLSNSQLSSTQRQQAALQIGQVHGNRYLQRVLAGASQPMGRIANTRTAQRAPAGKKKRVDWEAVLADLTMVRQRSTNEVTSAHNYLNEALIVAEATRTKLDNTADRYEEAFSQHERVVNRAKKKAASREGLLNTLMGIGIGITVGLIATAAIPATAGSSLILLGEFLAEAAEAGIGTGAGVLTNQNAGAINVKVNPLAMRLNHYRYLVDLYKGLAITGRDATGQGLLLGAIGDLITQARLHKEGAHADLPADQVVAQVNKLKKMDIYIAYPSGTLKSLKEGLDNRKIPSVRQFEQYIWIEWISSFGYYDEEYDRYFFDNTDVLDNDTIEDYLHGSIDILGSGSLLGVDFGWYTSEDDEEEAVVAANDAWHKLLNDYKDVLEPR